MRMIQRMLMPVSCLPCCVVDLTEEISARRKRQTTPLGYAVTPAVTTVPPVTASTPDRLRIASPVLSVLTTLRK
jgi:hypothetical protein